MSTSDAVGAKEAFDWIEASKKRRWDVTIFRNQIVQGAVVNVVAEEYHNVRSKWISSSGLVDHHGVLQFIDENGKDFAASSMPYVAKEVTPAP